MAITSLRLNSEHLAATVTRVNSAGEFDPEDEGFDIKFKDFDAVLGRASKAATAWDNMLRALAAIYRERRLMEKIEQLSALGLDTAALEAQLADVRTLLGIT